MTRITHCTNCHGECVVGTGFQVWKCHCGVQQQACAVCLSTPAGQQQCLELAREHKRESHAIFRN